LTQAQINSLSQDQWNAIPANNRTGMVGKTAPY